MGLTFAAGVFGLLAAAVHPDRFIGQRHIAAALNRNSPAFTIEVQDGRRRFRIGERISLFLVYDDVPNRRQAGEGRCRHYAVPVLDRTAGTRNPRRDFYRTGLGVKGESAAAPRGASPGQRRPSS